MEALVRLFYLLCGHAFADVFAQSTVMIEGKHGDNDDVPWTFWMASHALITCIPVIVVTQNWWLAMIYAATHFIIDTLKCMDEINWWVDQLIHVLVLAVIAVVR